MGPAVTVRTARLRYVCGHFLCNAVGGCAAGLKCSGCTRMVCPAVRKRSTCFAEEIGTTLRLSLDHEHCIIVPEYQLTIFATPSLNVSGNAPKVQLAFRENFREGRAHQAMPRSLHRKQHPIVAPQFLEYWRARRIETVRSVSNPEKCIFNSIRVNTVAVPPSRTITSSLISG